jgi:hypothetical protein
LQAIWSWLRSYRVTALRMLVSQPVELYAWKAPFFLVGAGLSHGHSSLICLPLGHKWVLWASHCLCCLSCVTLPSFIVAVMVGYMPSVTVFLFCNEPFEA